MAKRYTITFAPDTLDHLRLFEAKYLSLIKATIEEQLGYSPDHETRNRKPLNMPAAFGATWELRFSPHNSFRVLYAIVQPAKEVWILAIGVKIGNRLMVGDEEIEL
jgi:hypothetical protein